MYRIHFKLGSSSQSSHRIQTYTLAQARDEIKKARSRCGVIEYLIAPEQFVGNPFETSLLNIFDADGTLRKAISNSIAPSSLNDWELLKGVHAWRKSNPNAICAIASNQGGVAMGYVSESDAQGALLALADLLNIPHDAVFMCAAHPENEANHEDRKPNPGMLLKAAKYYGVPVSNCLMIGDRPEDEKAAKAAGMAFEWANVFF